MPESSKIAGIYLDEGSVISRTPQVEYERKIAIHDLLEENHFHLPGHDGPYNLHLSIAENRLVFDVRNVFDDPLGAFVLSLSPFKRVVREYFMVCDSYMKAIKCETPSRIEAIDMGRRGLHNEGAELLTERLSGKVEIDHQTSRRLFSLICLLHVRPGARERS